MEMSAAHSTKLFLPFSVERQLAALVDRKLVQFSMDRHCRNPNAWILSIMVCSASTGTSGIVVELQMTMHWCLDVAKRLGELRLFSARSSCNCPEIKANTKWGDVAQESCEFSAS
jgi:hypothetical protein